MFLFGLCCFGKYSLRATWRQKNLFCHIGDSLPVCHQRQQKQEFEAKTQDRDHGGSLLPGLLPGLSSATVLLQSRPTCLSMVTCTVSWTLLHQLAPKKMPDRYATGQSNGGNKMSQPRLPLPRDQVCVKLTAETKNDKYRQIHRMNAPLPKLIKKLS